MPITEQIEKIIAQRDGEATRSKKIQIDIGSLSEEPEKETLTRCFDTLHSFGVIGSLREINGTLLKEKGELIEDSYLEVDEENRIVKAVTSLSWLNENTNKISQIYVTLTKRINSSEPFDLEIRTSQGLQFSTSFDDPTASQLSRDGDTGRWDIRNVGDLDNELGFYVSPDDLRKGIEERLAKSYASLMS